MTANGTPPQRNHGNISVIGRCQKPGARILSANGGWTPKHQEPFPESASCIKPRKTPWSKSIERILPVKN